MIIFDRNLLIKRRERTSDSLYKADFLIKRSFENILERLSEMSREFPRVWNLGSRIEIKEQLKHKGVIEIIQSDISPDSLNILRIDEENIPILEQKFDLIISILNLHLVNDLPGCLVRLKENLSQNGVLIASIFGGNNLQELRETITETELNLFGGISPRMTPNIEIKQLGGLMQRAGFLSPVIDSDIIEVHYKSPIDLLYDIKNMGEANILLDRNKSYLGKNFWQFFSKNYINNFSINENEIMANYEILTMTGIKN